MHRARSVGAVAMQNFARFGFLILVLPPINDWRSLFCSGRRPTQPAPETTSSYIMTTLSTVARPAGKWCPLSESSTFDCVRLLLPSSILRS
jgi:hypothetical protein